MSYKTLKTVKVKSQGQTLLIPYKHNLSHKLVNSIFQDQGE